MVIYFQFNVKK